MSANRSSSTALRWLGVLVVVSLLFQLASVLRPDFVPKKPMSYDPAEVWLDHTVCAGDTVAFASRFEVLQPLVAVVVTSVIDEATGLTVPGSVVESMPRPRNRSESVDNVFEWTVPELDPGRYRRVNGTYGAGLGTQPAFFVVHFEFVHPVLLE